MIAKYLVLERNELNSLDKARFASQENRVEMESAKTRKIFAKKFREDVRKLREQAKLIDGEDTINGEDIDDEDWDDAENLSYEGLKAITDKSFALALETFDFDEELRKVISTPEVLSQITNKLIEKLVQEAGGTFKYGNPLTNPAAYANAAQTQPNQNIPQTPQQAQEVINQAQQLIKLLQQFVPTAVPTGDTAQKNVYGASDILSE